jgi:hypothetical protein
MIRARRNGPEYQCGLEFGFGTLGCMATQVHANIVTIQLQMMFQMVRQVRRLSQDDDVRSSMAGMGSARTLCKK